MKQIEDDLYLGDQIDANNYAEEMDHVLAVNNPRFGENEYLSEHPPAYEVDRHVGLNDGQNPQQKFDDAVDVARILMEKDGSLLIHCSAGVSRSATVLITAIAARDDRTFESVRQDVWEKKPDINPHPDLVTHARVYLGEIEPQDL